MVGKIRPPQNICVYLLLPGACKYVELHGKGEFKVTNGIKVANELTFKKEDYLPLSEWAQHDQKGWFLKVEERGRRRHQNGTM